MEKERVGKRERERPKLIPPVTFTDKGAMSEGHTSLGAWSGMAADVWSEETSLGQRWSI